MNLASACSNNDTKDVSDASHARATIPNFNSCHQTFHRKSEMIRCTIDTSRSM
jgi:hypothetical protein